MEVTMTKAAVLLGVSKKEVQRRIARGELKIRKRTASKFSDTLVTLPDGKQAEPMTKVVDIELTKRAEEKKDEELVEENTAGAIPDSGSKVAVVEKQERADAVSPVLERDNEVLQAARRMPEVKEVQAKADTKSSGNGRDSGSPAKESKKETRENKKEEGKENGEAIKQGGTGGKRTDRWFF
jgi:hypothetical protein